MTSLSSLPVTALVALEPAKEQRAQQLTDDERQQEHAGDADDGVEQRDFWWPCVSAIRLTSSGVMPMPIRLDSVALKIAAGTLPRAMPVIATDEVIVDGSTHR
jgi:hypothetical protein